MRNLAAGLALALLLSASGSALAAQDDHVSFLIDYQRIDVIDRELDLGYGGLHLLFDLPNQDNWYVGAAIYAAASGRYSGYFALGAEGGYRRPLFGPLEMDLGLAFSAGGGHGLGSQVLGEGHWLQGRAGLKYRRGAYRFGLGLARGRFLGVEGSASNSLVFQVESIGRIRRAAVGEDVVRTRPTKRKFFGFVGNAYFPHDQVTTRGGTPDTETSRLIGFQYGQEFASDLYFLFKFYGSVSGNNHGYADIFTGVGYRPEILPNLFLTGDLVIGSGGGASVDTGSGLLGHAKIGLEWQLTDLYAIEAGVGRLDGLSNSYASTTVNGALNLYLDRGGEGRTYQLAQRVGHQSYFSPQREYGPDDDIHLVSVKWDLYLSERFYLNGQTAFGYTGGVAGYFSGLIGAGYNIPVVDRLFVNVEALVGAAGGAGLALGEGFIVNPTAGLLYEFSDAWGAYASGSRLIAPQGEFDLFQLDFGLRYRWALGL